MLFVKVKCLVTSERDCSELQILTGDMNLNCQVLIDICLVLIAIM